MMTETIEAAIPIPFHVWTYIGLMVLAVIGIAVSLLPWPPGK